jgi:hypothetical protein
MGNYPSLETVRQAMIDRLDVAIAAPERPRWRPQSHYASKAGHACRFYLWALRAHWQDLPTPDLGLRRIFAAGSELEESVISALKRAGYRVTHQQVAFEDEQLNLRGRIDGYIWHEDFEQLFAEAGIPVDHRFPGIPMEIKGLAASYADECTSFAAMKESNMPWVRLYPGQLLCYGYMGKPPSPLVCMVVRNKGNNATWPILEWTEPWFDELVRIGETLGDVNRALRDGQAPQPIPYDSVWCNRCDAAAVCPTTLTLQGQGSINLDDNPGFGALLADVANNEASAAEHATAKAQAKAYLERTGNWPDEVGRVVTIVANGHMAQVEARGKPGAVKRFLSITKLGG